MTAFTVRRDIPAPAAQVWSLLTDWPAHGRWVPLTVVRTTSEQVDGVGTTFVGRTGLGPLAFDDPMTVVQWQVPDHERPGRCELRKDGRVVRGGAHFSVHPRGAGACTVDWTEDIEIVGIHRLPGAAALTSLVGRLGFATVLRALARELASRSLPHSGK